MLLFLDVETLPASDPAVKERLLANLKAPGQYKKEESIARWIEENAEAEWRKTSLDGGYGELLCIGFALDDDEADVTMRFLDDGTEVASERDLLERFLGGLRAYTNGQPLTVVGHNILWDLKFLYHRAAVLGLLDHYRAAKLPINPSPYGGQVFDTSREWTWDPHRGIALGELCDILGIENPKCEVNGMLLSGATVYDFHLAGYHGEIIDYCARDVEAVREVYKRLAL